MTATTQQVADCKALLDAYNQWLTRVDAWDVKISDAQQVLNDLYAQRQQLRILTPQDVANGLVEVGGNLVDCKTAVVNCEGGKCFWGDCDTTTGHCCYSCGDPDFMSSRPDSLAQIKCRCQYGKSCCDENTNYGFSCATFKTNNMLNQPKDPTIDDKIASQQAIVNTLIAQKNAEKVDTLNLTCAITTCTQNLTADIKDMSTSKASYQQAMQCLNSVGISNPDSGNGGGQIGNTCTKNADGTCSTGCVYDSSLDACVSNTGTSNNNSGSTGSSPFLTSLGQAMVPYMPTALLNILPAEVWLFFLLIIIVIIIIGIVLAIRHFRKPKYYQPYYSPPQYAQQDYYVNPGY